MKWTSERSRFAADYIPIGVHSRKRLRTPSTCHFYTSCSVDPREALCPIHPQIQFPIHTSANSEIKFDRVALSTPLTFWFENTHAHPETTPPLPQSIGCNGACEAPSLLHSSPDNPAGQHFCVDHSPESPPSSNRSQPAGQQVPQDDAPLFWTRKQEPGWQN